MANGLMARVRACASFTKKLIELHTGFETCVVVVKKCG